MTGFSIIDIVIGAVLLFFIYKGSKNGFMVEVGKIVALVSGFILANRFSTVIGEAVFSWIKDETVRALIGYLAIFFVTALIIGLVAKILQRLFEIMLLGWLNRLLGFLLGFLKGFLIVSLLIFILESIPTESVQNLHNRMNQDAPLYSICNNLKNWIIDNSPVQNTIRGFQKSLKSGELNDLETLKKYLEQK